MANAPRFESFSQETKFCTRSLFGPLTYTPNAIGARAVAVKLSSATTKFILRSWFIISVASLAPSTSKAYDCTVIPSRCSLPVNNNVNVRGGITSRGTAAVSSCSILLSEERFNAASVDSIFVWKKTSAPSPSTKSPNPIFGQIGLHPCLLYSETSSSPSKITPIITSADAISSQIYQTSSDTVATDP